MTNQTKPAFPVRIFKDAPELLAKVEEHGREQGFTGPIQTPEPDPAPAPRAQKKMRVDAKRISVMLEGDVYERLATKGVRERRKLQDMLEKWIIESLDREGY